MSYTKTTWVNNTTPINDTNLNKIEQGIYDNSLVVDAITNTLNPTDTETYKTAELTEGQITDVIGVNDILIKGQTSQDGTPTPSAPVNINVVSGSNVVNIYAKNILDGATWTKNQALNESNTAYTANGWEYSNYIDISQANYYYPGTNGESPRTILYDKNKNVIAVLKVSSNTVYNLSSYKAKYIRVSTTTAKKENTKVYQGKELPLDLPVENLFYYSDNFVSGTNAGITVTKQSDGSYTFIGTATSTGVNVWLNGNYNNYNDKVIENALFKIPAGKTITVTDLRVYMVYEDLTKKAVAEGTTLTLPQDAYIMAFRALDTTPNTTYNRVCYPQLEISSKANAYTPYGTDPIELCKIGNYQDYFYKSGSKWYLHKEIEKKVLNGSEEWTLRSGSRFSVDIPSADGDFISTGLSNQYKFIANWDTHVATNHSFTVRNGTWGVNKCRISLINTDYEYVTQFKADLATNNLIVYYQKISQLGGATDTEITDTTLISQLEAIYNAPLYEQTNITQTNNDLPMVLDITACKDNINGIKAFIRK